jgi:hypothetical protein
MSKRNALHFDSAAQQALPADAATRPEDRSDFESIFQTHSHTDLLVRRG